MRIKLTACKNIVQAMMIMMVMMRMTIALIPLRISSSDSDCACPCIRGKPHGLQWLLSMLRCNCQVDEWRGSKEERAVLAPCDGSELSHYGGAMEGRLEGEDDLRGGEGGEGTGGEGRGGKE